MLIYLDNAATTQVCPEAAQAALEVMTGGFGNPSSRYAPAAAAAAQLKKDRQTVADSLGCEAEELFFTSCGTEGDNWAIWAALEYGKRKGKHIVTTAIEHAAILEPMKVLEGKGYEVTYLKPDRSGHIDPMELESALRSDTVLVSVMLVNNELGTIQPVAAAAQAIKRTGCPALLHTDAVQGFLKVPFSPRALGVDLLTISGHKVHAPKGVGALYIRKELISKWRPLLLGGGQESGLRSGTEATAQVAALAAACRAWRENVDTEDIRERKEYFLQSFSAAIPEGKVVSAGDAPHICAVTLPGYPSEMLVRELSDRGICVSSGSACHKGKPSHVFAALGLGKTELMGVLRVSFGPGSSRADADALTHALAEIKSARIAVR